MCWMELHPRISLFSPKFLGGIPGVMPCGIFQRRCCELHSSGGIPGMIPRETPGEVLEGTPRVIFGGIPMNFLKELWAKFSRRICHCLFGIMTSIIARCTYIKYIFSWFCPRIYSESNSDIYSFTLKHQLLLPRSNPQLTSSGFHSVILIRAFYGFTPRILCKIPSRIQTGILLWIFQKLVQRFHQEYL